MRTTERCQEGGGTVYLTTDAQTARQRLAAYEDTGLEPEQVAALIATVRAMLREFDAAKKI